MIKKLLFSLILSLISFAAFSQIKNVFFGSQLGTSSKGYTIYQLQQSGYDYELCSDGSILLKNIWVGGCKWNKCYLDFCNDYFFQVKFESTEELNFEHYYYSTVSSLLSKYPSYYSDISVDGVDFFDDGSTRIICVLDSSSRITYSNSSLLRIKEKQLEAARRNSYKYREDF